MTLNFFPIQNYGSAVGDKPILINISEIFIPDIGWKPFSRSATPTQLHILRENGVTHVNFEMVMESGAVRYPDFSMAELSK